MKTETTSQPLGQRASVALALALAVVSVRSLRNGKRLRGVLAGVGALVLGYRTVTDTTDTPAMESVGDETTHRESAPVSSDETAVEQSVATTEQPTSALTCAVCGDAIVPGEKRGPNENGEIVHDTCA